MVATIVVFTLIAGCALAGFELERREVHAEILARMSAEADAKAALVENWRAERVSDGRSIAEHALIARVASRLRGGSLSPDSGDLAEWAASQLHNREYVGVAVLRPRGEVIVRAGEVPDHDLDFEPSAAIRDGATLIDFHRHSGGALHANLVAPLLLANGGGRELVGAVIFRLDPEAHLFPLVHAGNSGPEGTLAHLVRDASGETICHASPDPAPAAIETRRAIAGAGWSVRVSLDATSYSAWFGRHLDWILWLAIALMAAVALTAYLWYRHQMAAFLEQSRATEDARLARQLALDATDDGVWDWDVPKDALRLSSRFGAMLGAALPCARMDEALAALHPDERPELERRLGELVRGERSNLEVEHRIRCASGQWIWSLDRASVALRGPDGTATRIVGACTDITDRKALQAQLLISDRMAALGTLAAGVTHEINSPLAYVVANIAFARESLARLAGRAPLAGGIPRGAEAGGSVSDIVSSLDGALEDAREGSERVRAIVRDLRALSHTDDETRPIDVCRILEASLAIARHEITKRARIGTDLVPVPRICANEGRLGQVFLNLIVNAAQAIPEGKPSENLISVATAVDPGGRVAVEIRDTGCGIPPENLERIFDPFFTTKPAGVGTGLGLAICRRIVTDAGGDVRVDSEVGKGSRFRITLPACAGKGAEPVPPPHAAALPSRRGRILVIDDEPNVSAALQRLLGLEHEVVALTSAREALERIARGERFDVLLCDLQMPEMSGSQVVDELLSRKPDAVARLAFMSGGVGSPELDALLDRSGAAFLQKPFAPEALRALISNML